MMKRFFDTCDVIDYCSPSNSDDEWVIPDKGLFGTRNTVPTVPLVYPEQLTRDVKRNTQDK